ncbi:MAG: IS66 family insertion sequence element accessory protein TnpB [Bacteroidota bacterium]|nr:IS66 family insertion sequence element accessory protein TnpB [Bacteroidota bacterium]
MLSLNSAHRYFLYQGNCDMRRSFNGLCGLVVSELQLNATSGDVFIFVNRQRTHIKLLHWEHGGFVLYYKRLEEGTFALPEKQQLGWADLVLMIEGIQVQKSLQSRRYQL